MDFDRHGSRSGDRNSVCYYSNHPQKEGEIKTMKKTALLAMIVMLCLASSLLAACNDASSPGNPGENSPSGNTSNGKDTSVRDLNGRVFNYVCYWPEPEKGKSQSANEYWKRKEEIEKKYNCEIKHIFKSRDAIDREVIPSILAGDPIADVFAMAQEGAFPQVRRNTLYDLSSLPQFDFSEPKWSPGCKEMFTVDGKIYAFNASDGPYCREILLYNMDYFKSNNLPDLFELQGRGELDWDTLRQIAKDATKGNVAGFASQASDEFMTQALIRANGGIMVTRGESLDFTVTMNSQNTLYALDFWQKMRNEDRSTLEHSGWTYCSEQFGKGNAAMHYADLSNLEEHIIRNARFKIGVVLFPAGPHADLPYMVDQSIQTAYVMPITVKNPQDVAMVWDAFTEPGTLPWTEFYYDLFYNEDAIKSMQKYADHVRAGQFVIDYATCIGDVYETGISALLNEVANGEKTPAQGIEEVIGAINAAITAFNR
jgi:ABC-type glycerol-3-phosphate transport system substrate-binding protein